MVSIQQMHAGSRMRNALIVPRSGTSQRHVAIREFRGNYKQKRGGRTNQISHDDDEALYEVSDLASVNVVGSVEVKVDVDINGTPISFTVDTASSVSIISEETYTKHFKSVSLRD